MLIMPPMEKPLYYYLCLFAEQKPDQLTHLKVIIGYTEVGYSPPYNIMNSWFYDIAIVFNNFIHIDAVMCTVSMCMCGAPLNVMINCNADTHAQLVKYLC